MPPKVSLLIKKSVQSMSMSSTSSTSTNMSLSMSSKPEFQRKKDENTETKSIDGICVIRRAHNKMNFYLEEHEIFAEIEKQKPSGPGPGPKKEYVNISNEDRDDYMDELETRKYKLIKKRDKTENAKARTAISDELLEVQDVLGKLKRLDVKNRVDNTRVNRDKIDSEFRTSKHSLELRDFRRIVDLTAPKKEREPDITTTIWKQSKSVYKDSKYRETSDENTRKFEKRMQNLVKPMPKEMAKEIRDRNKDTIKKISISKHHPELLKYGKYDPSTYNGLLLI